ncbi:MAG: metallophosphoesterase family protein, partial [Gemmatimonadales bacterium]
MTILRVTKRYATYIYGSDAQGFHGQYRCGMTIASYMPDTTRPATTLLPLGLVLGLASCALSESEPALRFRPDGTFTIVQFTDTQDDQDIDPRTVQLIEAVLDDQRPDLVVFSGDNIRSGPQTPEDVWNAIASIADPVEARGIPWLITFGNHDQDHVGTTGIDEPAMLERYMSYPHNVNRPSDAGVHGTGNMHALIYASQSETPVFNVWALDAGRYAPDTIGGQAIGDDGLPGWDWIRHGQVHWYFQTSEQLEARFGRKIPSLMFFHIPLWEHRFVWDQRENHGVVGEKKESVSSGPFNSGLFATMLERGDVKGVFVGHDHVNDYEG